MDRQLRDAGCRLPDAGLCSIVGIPIFRIPYPVLVFMLSLLITSACKRTTLLVEKLPENTPKNAALFVSGNFNYWDPGDRTYELKRLEDGRLMAELPVGWGTIAYKITRGDWHTVEADPCGHEIVNHTYKEADG